MMKNAAESSHTRAVNPQIAKPKGNVPRELFAGESDERGSGRNVIAAPIAQSMAATSDCSCGDESKMPGTLQRKYPRPVPAATVKSEWREPVNLPRYVTSVTVSRPSPMPIRKESATAEINESGKVATSADAPHITRPTRIRSNGPAKTRTRGASRLIDIPPSAIAPITACKWLSAIPSAARRFRNANCAKIRK